MTGPLPDESAYRELLAELDRWFAGGAAAAPAPIPCRAGCSACCHGPFDISAADAELVRAAVRRLPESERAEVARRARSLLDAMHALAPDWGPPWAIADLGDDRFDALGDALAGAPCPLLDDAGRCRIYDDRPLVCRLIGLPMATPAGRVLENACPIRDEFPAYAALEPVMFDLEAFELREDGSLEAAEARGMRETTIAAVVAGDGGGRWVRRARGGKGGKGGKATA